MKKFILFLLILNVINIKAQHWIDVGGGTNGTIRTLAVYNGELYAGGQFTNAGGATVNGVAKWDGNNWSSVGLNANYLNKLFVHNNELFACGSFLFPGPVSSAVVKFNGLTWEADTIIQYTVGGLKNFTTFNSDLYVVGNINFLNINGNYIFYGDIAKWNGTNWDTLNGGIDGYHLTFLNDAEVFNNELYVGGHFTSASGVPANNIARWNGLGWDSVGTGLGGTIHTLKVYNGALYAGGWLNLGLAKWDGSNWNHVGNTGISGGMWTGVDAMTIFNNELVVAGDFDMAGNIPANNIASWDGTIFKTFGSGIKRRVLALVEYNGELYAAGDFDSAGTNPMNYISKWSSGVSVNENENVSEIQIYPNPVSENCHIRLSLSRNENISITIVDVTGKKVSTITENQEFTAGGHHLMWNTNGLASGVYLLKIESDSVLRMRKVVVTNNR